MIGTPQWPHDGGFLHVPPPRDDRPAFLSRVLTVGSCACPRFLEAISFVFPLMLMMAWVLFVADFVKKLVHERELRLHEVTLSKHHKSSLCFKL